MSNRNRTDLSNLRALLHDTASDLRGIELTLIDMRAEGHVRRARHALRLAIGELTDALTRPLDHTPEQVFAVLQDAPAPSASVPPAPAQGVRGA